MRFQGGFQGRGCIRWNRIRTRALRRGSVQRPPNTSDHLRETDQLRNRLLLFWSKLSLRLLVSEYI